MANTKSTDKRTAKSKKAHLSRQAKRKLQNDKFPEKQKFIEKNGKLVSKARSANAKTHLGKYSNAVKQARKELGSVGFVPIGGKSKAGQALLKKVRAILQS